MIEGRDGGFTVGALVQTNFGYREWLRVDGVPVGEVINDDVSSRARTGRSATPVRGRHERRPPPGSGSIIVVVATDAPLLPHQCERLAQRAGLGLARAGSIGGHTSGELFLCFATGNKLTAHGGTEPMVPVTMLDDDYIDPLFMATVESTEEAVINALVAAETMTGRDGHTGTRSRMTCSRTRWPATPEGGSGPDLPCDRQEAAPAATCCAAGFSIGTPTRLPYSVQLPS